MYSVPLYKLFLCTFNEVIEYFCLMTSLLFLRWRNWNLWIWSDAHHVRSLYHNMPWSVHLNLSSPYTSVFRNNDEVAEWNCTVIPHCCSLSFDLRGSLISGCRGRDPIHLQQLVASACHCRISLQTCLEAEHRICLFAYSWDDEAVKHLSLHGRNFLIIHHGSRSARCKCYVSV